MFALTDKFQKGMRFLNRTDGALGEQAIRSGLWVGISNVGINLLSFVRTVILARLLMPEVFGLISICMIVKRGVDILTETGFAAALIHRQDKFEEAKDTAFSLLVIRGFVLAIAVFLLAPFVANYYERTTLDDLIKVIAVIFVLVGFANINTVSLRKELNFKHLTYLAQATSLINLFVVVVLAYYLRNVWSIVIAQIFTALVHVILSYVIIPGKPRLRFSRELAKELFGYGKFITGVAIFGFIASELDKAVVGKILGMEALGFYVIAYKLASLPTSHFSKIMARMMLPVCSKVQNDLSKLREIYLKALKFVGGLAIPLSAGLAVLAPEFIEVLYGEKWLPAVGALQVLCVFGCFMAVGSWAYVFNALGKPHIPFYFNLGKVFGIAVLIYPLTRSFGLIGTAMAVTIPVVIQFGVQVFVTSRVIDLKVTKILSLLSSIVGKCLVMVMTVLFCKRVVAGNDIYSLAVVVAAGILSYGIFHYREILFVLRKMSILKSPG